MRLRAAAPLRAVPVPAGGDGSRLDAAGPGSARGTPRRLINSGSTFIPWNKTVLNMSPHMVRIMLHAALSAAAPNASRYWH